MKLKARFLNSASLAVLLGVVCTSRAQTYQIGPETQNQNAKPGQKQSQKQTSAQEPNLGFGSNIENARLGRAAEQALQRGDKVRALEFAQRAAQAAPNVALLGFLVGYAARLNARYQQSADAYSHGLRINPSSLEGLSGLAQTYAAMGKNNDAQRLLKQVLAANPKRANDALVLGDVDEAAETEQGIFK